MGGTLRYFIPFQDFRIIQQEGAFSGVGVGDKVVFTLETARLTLTLDQAPPQGNIIGLALPGNIIAENWEFFNGDPILTVTDTLIPYGLASDVTLIDIESTTFYSDFDDIVPLNDPQPSSDFFTIFLSGRVEEDFGGGFDVFDGSDVPRADVTMSAAEDGLIAIEVVPQPFEPAEGNDVTLVRNLEKLQLAGGAYIFDLEGASCDEVYRLYDAAFARTPDEAGLRFWADEVESGSVALEDLPNAFIASGEFGTLFGTDPSDVEFVTALYGNVLRRAPDDEGLAFWTEAFGSGALGPDDMLAQFSESDENIARNAKNLDIGVWVI